MVLEQDSPRSVAGKVAIITGGAKGIGRAAAMLFAREGAHVAIIDRDEVSARQTVEAIIAEGGSGHAWPLDITDAAGIITTTEAVADRFGGIDILINNAGFGSRLSIDDEGYEQNWTLLIDALLTAQQRFIRAALPHLRRSRSARILNIGSTEALGGTAGNSGYAAAKAGVVGLTRALAIELGRSAITVNCICPGPILTDLTRRITSEDRATFARRRTALGRYGEPDEVGHMILSLCLPAASYVTGAIIPVDGGLTARNA